MKKGILFLSVLFSAFLTTQSFAQEIINGPAISFDKETHDYGTISVGANGECVFTIKNTGTEPLLITNAQASCGCTVPDYPKEPIAPGQSASIKVSYDTKRVGVFQKSITISSNAQNGNVKVIYIKGNVEGQIDNSAAPVAPVTGPTTGTTSGTSTFIAPR